MSVHVTKYATSYIFGCMVTDVVATLETQRQIVTQAMLEMVRTRGPLLRSMGFDVSDESDGNESLKNLFPIRENQADGSHSTRIIRAELIFLLLDYLPGFALTPPDASQGSKTVQNGINCAGFTYFARELQFCQTMAMWHADIIASRLNKTTFEGDAIRRARENLEIAIGHRARSLPADIVGQFTEVGRRVGFLEVASIQNREQIEILMNEHKTLTDRLNAIGERVDSVTAVLRSPFTTAAPQPAPLPPPLPIHNADPNPDPDPPTAAGAKRGGVRSWRAVRVVNGAVRSSRVAIDDAEEADRVRDRIERGGQDGVGGDDGGGGGGGGEDQKMMTMTKMKKKRKRKTRDRPLGPSKTAKETRAEEEDVRGVDVDADDGGDHAGIGDDHGGRDRLIGIVDKNPAFESPIDENDDAD